MVPEIIIVVPPLLGLKGNLEMTLAARYVRESHICKANKEGFIYVTQTKGVSIYVRQTKGIS